MNERCLLICLICLLVNKNDVDNRRVIHTFNQMTNYKTKNIRLRRYHAMQSNLTPYPTLYSLSMLDCLKTTWRLLLKTNLRLFEDLFYCVTTPHHHHLHHTYHPVNYCQALVWSPKSKPKGLGLTQKSYVAATEQLMFCRMANSQPIWSHCAHPVNKNWPGGQQDQGHDD